MFKQTIRYLGCKIYGLIIREYLISLAAESDRVAIMNFIDEQAPDTTFMVDDDGDWLAKDEIKTVFLKLDEDYESIHRKAWSELGLHMALREKHSND